MLAKWSKVNGSISMEWIGSHLNHIPHQKYGQIRKHPKIVRNVKKFISLNMSFSVIPHLFLGLHCARWFQPFFGECPQMVHLRCGTSQLPYLPIYGPYFANFLLFFNASSAIHYSHSDAFTWPRNCSKTFCAWQF